MKSSTGTPGYHDRKGSCIPKMSYRPNILPPSSTVCEQVRHGTANQAAYIISLAHDYINAKRGHEHI